MLWWLFYGPFRYAQGPSNLSCFSGINFTSRDRATLRKANVVAWLQQRVNTGVCPVEEYVLVYPFTCAWTGTQKNATKQMDLTWSDMFASQWNEYVQNYKPVKPCISQIKLSISPYEISLLPPRMFWVFVRPHESIDSGWWPFFEPLFGDRPKRGCAS